MTSEFIWDDRVKETCKAVFPRRAIEEAAHLCAQEILCCDGFMHPALIGIEITDDAGIRRINRTMRGIDAATDVLSFPAIRFKAGEKSAYVPRKRDIDIETGCIILGDVVISLERAASQAEEYGHSILREVGYLCAHSAAHLLGYDHMNEEDKTLMRALEEKAMNAAGFER